MSVAPAALPELTAEVIEETGMIAVTGASGGIGGRVARSLAADGVQQRLIVRDPQRAPALADVEVAQASYDDAEAMRTAFAGADTLFLVSASEDRNRVALHTNAVDAAVAAGVGRIVYLSFLNAAPDATFTFARDHHATEEHIKSTGLAFTFLRDSLYADYIPFMAGADGVIRGPAGDGAVAVVSRDDIADVATAVLTSDAHDGATYDITGPESLTFNDMAQHLSDVTGRSVTYVAETMDEARASRASYGAPDWEVEGWITSYAAVASGELDVVSDTVARLAGHQPQSLLEYLRAHPEDCRHLVAS